MWCFRLRSCHAATERRQLACSVEGIVLYMLVGPAPSPPFACHSCRPRPTHWPPVKPVVVEQLNPRESVWMVTYATWLPAALYALVMSLTLLATALEMPSTLCHLSRDNCSDNIWSSTCSQITQA